MGYVVVKLGHDADSENNTAPSFNLKPNRRPGAGGIAGALSRVRRKSLPKDQIVPFCSVLGLDNVQDCIEVEEAFPEMERCTKEKFEYRLTTCPELCLGIFNLPPLSAQRKENNGVKPRPKLLGHVIATRTSSMTVTDESMKLPENWQTKTSHIPGPGEKAIGHEEQGTTIALHSLAVRREYQGKGMGSTVLREFLQRMDNAKTAERVAIISHEHLIKYYEKIGFKNMGPSKAQFGGGGWFDLVFELRGMDD